MKSKLQKRDQDIFEAYMMVDEVEETLTATFKSGTKKSQALLGNWESLKLFPERQAYRGIAQTLPVLVQLIITKYLRLLSLLTS